MVLESLMTPEGAERKPWLMFLMGILYSSVAVIISLSIFQDIQASWVMVFLTVLASVTLMYKTLVYEEDKDTRVRGEMTLLREHSKAIVFFLLMFLGFTVSFTAWGLFLPAETTTTLFHFQANAIEGVNGAFSGFSFFSDNFLNIFTHNLSILVLSFIFSFIGLGILDLNQSFVHKHMTCPKLYH